MNCLINFELSVASLLETLVTQTEIESIRQHLELSQAPLVLTHERPDGDAIGSLLAMGLALKSMGKQPRLAIVDGVPARFQFLPGASDVQKRLPDSFDLLIVLDCADMGRIGYDLARLGKRPDINIDHHPTNENFASINYIQHEAAATAELLYALFLELKIPIDQAMSQPLMLGILTDTIGFRTTSVHPGLLRIAADLLEKGAQLSDLYDRALNQRSYLGSKYWGRGLLHLERQGEMLWTELTLEDRKAVDYPGNDDADLVNLLTTIEAPSIVLIFVEQTDNKVKVSWRSKLGYNVARVATSFGGGGHEQAAGAMIVGSLEEVKVKVLHNTQKLLETPTEEQA
jgi:phosphoesterase RecJ-like protein